MKLSIILPIFGLVCLVWFFKSNPTRKVQPHNSKEVAVSQKTSKKNYVPLNKDDMSKCKFEKRVFMAFLTSASRTADHVFFEVANVEGSQIVFSANICEKIILQFKILPSKNSYFSSASMKESISKLLSLSLLTPKTKKLFEEISEKIKNSKDTNLPSRFQLSNGGTFYYEGSNFRHTYTFTLESLD